VTSSTLANERRAVDRHVTACASVIGPSVPVDIGDKSTFGILPMANGHSDVVFRVVV